MLELKKFNQSEKFKLTICALDAGSITKTINLEKTLQALRRYAICKYIERSLSLMHSPHAYSSRGGLFFLLIGTDFSKSRRVRVRDERSVIEMDVYIPVGMYSRILSSVVVQPVELRETTGHVAHLG